MSTECIFYPVLHRLQLELESKSHDIDLTWFVALRGGDEVKTDCWTESAEVVAWMKAKNLTAMGALGYFQTRVQQIVQKHGKAAMFWDEFWAADLQALNSTVAEIRGTTFASTLSQGRPALTTGINEVWYLDHGVSNPRFIQSDWEAYYMCV